MLASYFKITLRYSFKNKIFSIINIAGLSISLACAMLMILYTKDELSFDKFHQDLSSIHLIAIDVQNADGSSFDKMSVTSILHGPRFKEKLPEVASFVRLNNKYMDIQLGDEIKSQKVLEADANFFSFFTFPLVQGDPTTALKDIHSIVISEDMAIRHFGKNDPLNRTILFESDGALVPYTVRGVSRRSPRNSSIQFEAVISLTEVYDDFSWVNVSYSTFVKLNKGSDVKSVTAKMQQVFESESEKVMEQVRSYGFTQFFYHQLQPLANVHLSEDFKAEAGLSKGSSAIYSYILSGIAAFILIIACINFINLTLARSAKRAQEIGIRKVVGGGRRQLIMQFLGESFFLCLLSFIGAMILAQFLLPVFNHLVNKQLSLSYLLDGRLIGVYVGLFLLTGVLAGFYPAIVLSGYRPVQTLYARFQPGKSYFQKALVVFQFALATFMLVATLTVYLQFDYLTTRDLGYNPDNVVKVTKRKFSHREAIILSDALSKNPNIISISPQHHGSENGKINGDSILHFTYEAVNENFIDLLNIKLAQGRNFSSLNISDSANSVIVNQAFVERAGWKEPLAQEVKMMDGSTRNVIGIVSDYNYESLKRTIEPQLFSLAFNSENKNYQHLLIRIRPNSESNCISFIGKTFKELFPLYPFSYEFYNEGILLSYETESKWKQVILLSALLTIFIAGIGLFGLSIFTAETRVKEIAIRKVLGASVKTIVFLVYKEHFLLISLALIIALPISYYAAGFWLERYPYRTEFGPVVLITAALFVVAIAGVTVSYQTFKTALLNPASSLRTS